MPTLFDAPALAVHYSILICTNTWETLDPAAHSAMFALDQCLIASCPSPDYTELIYVAILLDPTNYSSHGLKRL
jgi:hypothetical protein